MHHDALVYLSIDKFEPFVHCDALHSHVHIPKDCPIEQNHLRQVDDAGTNVRKISEIK